MRHETTSTHRSEPSTIPPDGRTQSREFWLSAGSGGQAKFAGTGITELDRHEERGLETHRGVQITGNAYVRQKWEEVKQGNRISREDQCEQCKITRGADSSWGSRGNSDFS